MLHRRQGTAVHPEAAQSAEEREEDAPKFAYSSELAQSTPPHRDAAILVLIFVVAAALRFYRIDHPAGVVSVIFPAVSYEAPLTPPHLSAGLTRSTLASSRPITSDASFSSMSIHLCSFRLVVRSRDVPLTQPVAEPSFSSPLLDTSSATTVTLSLKISATRTLRTKCPTSGFASSPSSSAPSFPSSSSPSCVHQAILASSPSSPLRSFSLVSPSFPFPVRSSRNALQTTPMSYRLDSFSSTLP